MNSTPPEWQKVDLSKYSNTWWRPGRSQFTITLWRYLGMPLVKHIPSEVFPASLLNSIKIFILRLFGAKIGKNCVIRNCEVYYPWNLEIGDNVWIGYEANLYSLVPIKIGNNVCISQRAFLCTGSHDPYDPGFGLIVGEIVLKDASWVCAGSFVGPSVTLHEGAVAAAGSVVVKDLPEMTICAGNPCKPLKKRTLSGTPSREERQ